MPSAIARNPLMPIMPSTCRLMGWWGMASRTRSTRRRSGASRALPMRMPEALTASTVPPHHHRLGDDGTEALTQGRR